MRRFTATEMHLCGVELEIKDSQFVVSHAMSDTNPWVCAQEKNGQLINGA